MTGPAPPDKFVERSATVLLFLGFFKNLLRSVGPLVLLRTVAPILAPLLAVAARLGLGDGPSMTGPAPPDKFVERSATVLLFLGFFKTCSGASVP